VWGSWANFIEAGGFGRPQVTGPPPHSLGRAGERRTIELYERYGAYEAARRLGITANGVYQRLGRMGYHRRNTNGHPEEVRAEAVKLYRDGMSSREVARRLGVSAPSVLRWAREQERNA